MNPRVATMEYHRVDGKPLVEGERVSVDHHVTTLTVTVRSTSWVGPNDLKALIETKHEVIEVNEIQHRLMVKPMPVGDEQKQQPLFVHNDNTFMR